MPDTLTPWRNELSWLFCDLCGEPIGAYMLTVGDNSDCGFLCHNCTGFHPRHVTPESLEKLAARWEPWQPRLAAHWRELAARERARPPLVAPSAPPVIDLEGIEL
jgi:hypothetical protein